MALQQRIPPPESARPTEQPKRLLQASLRPPVDARWSRPSSIVVSVIVHALLFLAVRELLWKKPVETAGPVFQIFRLTQPVETPRPITVPVAAPPKPQEEKQTVVRTNSVTQPPQQQAQPAAPVIAEPTEVPTTLPPSGAPVAEPSYTAAPPLTPAQRLLQSGTLAPGLVPPAPGPPAMPTPQEIAAARLANGIAAYNDSVAGAVEAARRARDWTKTDRNGGRWGVSSHPGSYAAEIHLGSVTIPLPFSFSLPPGRRDDAAKAARIYAESNAQAQRMEVEETFQSRVKAIRKRKDAQRDSARAASGGH